MNDVDAGNEQAGSPRRRTVAVAAAVGAAGLVAGGLAAGTLSAASADPGGAGDRAGYGVQRDGYGARPAPGEGPPGREGADCPDGAGRGPGGEGAGEGPGPGVGERGRPPTPGEQDSPPATEESTYRHS